MNHTFLHHLQNSGIIYHVSCPYTPEQNGMVECHHRTIRELGVTMMMHANVSKIFWVEAFTIAVFLINRLPTRVLDWDSPYARLFGHAPDYGSLRVFGSRCYPYLWDRKDSKFDTKSLPCIFLGYSDRHKGYRCYYPSSRRVYISRHVVFDETLLPFTASDRNKAGNPEPMVTTFNDWVAGPHTWCSGLGISNTSTVSATDDQPIPLPAISAEESLLPQHVEAPTSAHLNALESPASQSTADVGPSNLLASDIPVEASLPSAVAPISLPLTSQGPLTAGITPSNTSPGLGSLDDRVVTPVIPPTRASVPVDHSLVASPPNLEGAPSHPMVTRAKSGIHKPNPKYALLHDYASIPKEPKSVKSALSHPGWRAAMQEELAALSHNLTWSLVPRHPSMNVVGSRWVYKTKLKADGTLERLKARLVAKGYHQVDGLDFIETYSPVVKPGTIRLVLSLAVVRGWPIRYLDVKNVFLHGHLTEQVYMDQPPGFEDPVNPTHVCLLHRALYGLKQAPRAWFDHFSSFLLSSGFQCCAADPSLFVHHSPSGILILLLYVDDIILIGSSDSILSRCISSLSHEFAMKDLGPLHYFLGIQVAHVPSGLFLHQTKYSVDLLERDSMDAAKPSSTPMCTKFKSDQPSPPYRDPHHYRSIVGALQYLTLTRPDLAFSVNYVSQFMQAPTDAYFTMVRRILRYVKATIGQGLHIQSQSTLDLYAFSDADWVGCPITRRSTTGYCTFLESNIVSWCAKKQPTVSRSSSEAEYRAMAHAAAELTWLTFLLRALCIPLPSPALLFCDNMSSLSMTVNPVFHARSKHIELDYHFVRERVALGLLITRYVPTHGQLADIFTKAQSRMSLVSLRAKLCLTTLPSLRGDDKQAASEGVKESATS
ncbi:hypothetical protein Dimus_039233 [Dionaea muscipula]